MRRPSSATFSTVTTQGGLFSPEFLVALAAGTHKSDIPGLTPADFHLPGSETISEAINRSWNTLRGRWEDFKARSANLAKDEAATGLTRDQWLLPLFQELNYGRLPVATRFEIEGREYPVSHLWGHTPIHLLGVGLSLDTRTAGAAGAARMSPHAMLQEFLNRSDKHLWGIVSNGLRLRVLRDNIALTRQPYVEFDLQAMFDGNHFADFSLLWILCHESRVDADRPELCWLEKWTQEARKQGVRLLEHLREGVEQSITALGTGFIAHPANQHLRDRLRTGQLNAQDYYRQVLRSVYRLIFLFVAEDRDVLLLPELKQPKATAEACKSRREARERYATFYSTRRIRDLALKRAGTLHADLWEMLRLVTNALGADNGCPALALPALGSFLWSDTAVPDLAGASLSNRSLLDAVRALASTKSAEEKIRRIVDYRNLGAEELGSVYESLLELHPKINLDARRFALATSAGNERKTTGSHYTPDPLVMCLIESALDPVIQQRLAAAKTREEKERALLSLKVCDKACGSGHFLIRAGHRIARNLAAVRTGEEAPSPEAYRQALRDVIGHCLYGVDINPMAVELCKINLWLEALEPGKPLSFLDRHIRCGNSLLGVTPNILAKGIPDEAFDPIEGDDRKACAALKKLNARERKGFGELFAKEDLETQSRLQQAAAALDDLPDNNVQQIRQKAEALTKVENDPAFQQKRLIADAWCAAFVFPKTVKPGATAPVAITQRHLDAIARGQSLPPEIAAETLRLANQYQFLHFHLAFPEVFAQGGFDVNLGNPPWERVKLQEREWFAERRPDIATAKSAADRKRLIEDLKAAEPDLHRQFLADARKSEGESHIMRHSGMYPLCGRGDVNLYAVFAERMRSLIKDTGRVGCVLPSGIATDDTTKFFFQDVVEKSSLATFFDFENKLLLFSAVAPVVKFCLFVAGSGHRPFKEKPVFIFFAHRVEDLHDEKRRFTLSTEDISTLNPNTRTCPIFRSATDAELTKVIYRRTPVLLREAREDQPETNPWGIRFNSMFHMSNDSHLFKTREALEKEGYGLTGNTYSHNSDKYLPLYEAKLFHQFNHRPSTFDGIPEADRFQMKAPTKASTPSQLADPNFAILPRFWVHADKVAQACESYNSAATFLVFRGMTNVMTNSRNAVFTVIPRTAVGNSAPLCILADPSLSFAFLAAVNSFAFDYCTRQKLAGGNMNFFIVNQLPMLPPTAYSQPCAWSCPPQTLSDWLMPRVLELVYNSWDLQPFAEGCGCHGPPFRWNDDRRFLLRCELDAAFFHLYLGSDQDWHQHPEPLRSQLPSPRDAAAYIMDTFRIVRRKDEEKYDGVYRTKNTILEIYDALAHASKTRAPYISRLSPQPADPQLRHPER